MTLFEPLHQQSSSEPSTFVTTAPSLVSNPPVQTPMFTGQPLFCRSLSAPSHAIQFSEYGGHGALFNHSRNSNTNGNVSQDMYLSQARSQLVDRSILIEQQQSYQQQLLQQQQQTQQHIHQQISQQPHPTVLPPMANANYTYQSMQQQQPIHPFQMDMLQSSLQSSVPEAFNNNTTNNLGESAGFHHQQMAMSQSQQQQPLHLHPQFPHQQTSQRPQQQQQQQFHPFSQLPPQPNQHHQHFFQPSPFPGHPNSTSAGPSASSISLVSDTPSSMSLSSQGRSLSISSISTAPSSSSSCSPTSFHGGFANDTTTTATSSSSSPPINFRPATGSRMSRVPSLPFYNNTPELSPPTAQQQQFDVLTPQEEQHLCAVAYGFPRHGSVGSLYPLTHSHELLDPRQSMEMIQSSFSSASASSVLSSSPSSLSSSLGGAAMVPSLSSTSITSTSSSPATTTSNRRRVSRAGSITFSRSTLGGSGGGSSSNKGSGAMKQRRNSESPDSPSKLYLCTHLDCARQFKRNEHMKRHVKSVHTPEKPFHCPYPDCIKRFARSDNLHQHTRIHRQEKEKLIQPMFTNFNNIVSTGGGPTRRKTSSSVGL